MAVPRSRILDLLKAQSRIFNTTFNPTNARLGNSVLRERLRGPSLAAYYPRRVATFKDLRKLYPEFELYDNFEEDRLEHIQIAKSRGKGAPKKKRTAAGKLHFSRGFAGRCWSRLLTVMFLQRVGRIRRVRRGSLDEEEEVENFVDLAWRLGWVGGDLYSTQCMARRCGICLLQEGRQSRMCCVCLSLYHKIRGSRIYTLT
jgi:hypothetical protein